MTSVLPSNAPARLDEFEVRRHSGHPARRPTWRQPLRSLRYFVRRHVMGATVAGSAAIAAFVVLTRWFHSGAMYARGDVGPFVRDSLRAELGGMWTHQSTGAGGPTYVIGRSIEIVALDIAHALGGGDALAQRLLFAAIFAFAASGVAAFAARLTTRPWLVLGAGLLGAFNPLVMINLPNFLIPVCIGIVAWFGAMAFDAAAGSRAASPRRFAVVTIAVAYLSSNPPLLGVVLLVGALLPIIAALLSGTGVAGARRCVRFLARAALWAVPLALWWLIPYVSALRAASVGGTIGANTDVFAWSWTQAHSTLDRVLALVAKWSWPDTKFGTSASVDAAPVLLWLSFALPIALFAAPLVAAPARRRAALWLVASALGIALVAKGLNSPLRDVNSFAYRHVPGMWLLREPMSKVGALLAIASIAGWVIAVDGLARGRRRIGDFMLRSDYWRRVALLGLFLPPLVFAWPMFTGAVVQHSDRVRVPAAWHQVANVLNDSPVAGKALVLPLDDFYQVPTTWGFYGADTLPAQLFKRPTLARNPQSYLANTVNLDALVHTVETGLASGDAAAVPGALNKLGVAYVVVRKDIDYASPVRAVDMVRPEPLLTSLDEIGSARLVARTKVADVYEVDGGSSPVTALNGTIAATGLKGDALASVVASAPAQAAIVSTPPGNSPLLRGRSWYLDVNEPKPITPPAAGVWQYERRAADVPLLELAPDPRGAVMREPVAMQIDGTTVAQRPDLVVSGPGRAVAVQIGESLTDISHGSAYARVATGARVQTFSRAADTPIDAWRPVVDCNHYDGRSMGEAGLRADAVTTSDGHRAMRLRATRHAACISAPVPGAQPGSVVRVAVAQQAVRGAPPRTCLWMQGPRDCASLDWTARPSGKWYELSALARIPANAGEVSMFLYADEPSSKAGTGTEVLYRDVHVQQLAAGPPATVEPVPLPTGRLNLARRPVSVATQLRIDGASVGAPSEVGDCARKSGKSLQELGISATHDVSGGHTSVTLNALADSACVSLPVFGLHRDVTYEVQFDASASRGAVPRLCLWEDSAKRCTRLQGVSVPRGSGTFRYRGRVDPMTSAWRLFLYADAGRGPATISYRNVRLRAIADEALVLQPVAVGASKVGRVEVESASSDSYRVHVDNARGSFLLALNESYASGWKVHGLPKGATAKHIEIDGYRNGWAIDGARGDLDLVLRYAPAGNGRMAARVSELTLLVLLLSLFRTPALRRTGRRLRARHAQARREGPRRILLPDSWPND